MHKAVYILMSILVLPGLVFTQRDWISFTCNAVGTPPILEVVESNNLRTVIHVTIPGMWVEDTLINGTTYQVLRIPENGLTGEVGKPQLPIVGSVVAVPPTADVLISIIDSMGMILEGYMVYPAQPATPMGEPTPPFQIDVEFYRQDIWYPFAATCAGNPAIWRDMRIVSSWVYPIKFNPAQQKLIVYPEMTVALEYCGVSTVNPLPGSYASAISLKYAQMYRSLIINYDFLGILAVEDTTLGTYLFMTRDEFADELDSLVTWKQKKGYRTKMIQFSFAPSWEEVRRLIQGEYYSSEGLDYVLLVGDSADIPPWPRQGEEFGYNDFLYTCIAGGDTIPDLAIGRFSVANEVQVTRLVKAIQDYEVLPGTILEDWDVGHALFVAHFEVEPAHFRDFKEATRLYPQQWQASGYGVDTCYGTEGPYPNNNVVAYYINDDDYDLGGVGLVNYYGHGMWDRWWGWADQYQEHFTIQDIYALHNDERLPIWVNYACHTGRFGAPECFCEALIRNPNGGGTGALGATFPMHVAIYCGDFDIDNWLIKTIFTLSDDIYCPYPINRIGDAINVAKTAAVLWPDTGRPHNANMRNVVTWNYFGDPETPVWTAPPDSLLATHPTRIGIGPTNFTVDVDPEPNRDGQTFVCLYKPLEFQVGGYTDQNGMVTFQIDPHAAGTLYVTATKQSYFSPPICESWTPYAGICEVAEERGGPMSSDSSGTIPRVFALRQNHPNPFSSNTTIYYDLPEQISQDVGVCCTEAGLPP
jgi:hypothetical protein